jgi:hypothetical protein
METVLEAHVAFYSENDAIFLRIVGTHKADYMVYYPEDNVQIYIFIAMHFRPTSPVTKITWGGGLFYCTFFPPALLR